ncbi:Diphosphoinositol polyphosphate phosphohydrolase 1 [Myotis davidii]|uniref:diphosphoinositol-polyphosphate diphosphatase n=2 Tax=Myotis TaxID=9434 RepID=L5MD25_MYODS|nr:Diphosphoinositol polyphosphate phosphohydrolase 1 [Myotis davidii]
MNQNISQLQAEIEGLKSQKTSLEAAIADADAHGELAVRDAQAKVAELEATQNWQLCEYQEEHMDVRLALGMEIATYTKLLDGEKNQLVLLVSSSRHPDRWIVPGGGMEPEEEPSVAAVREVCEEAGVKGTLGRLVGIFENQERKHRTYVYVLIVTEVLEDWEDSVNIGRKREWFKVEEAIKVLQYHKPVQASYFETLRQGYSANNGTPVMAIR